MQATEGPLVLAREGQHGPVLHDVNAAAAKLGMKRGARVTDMKTLVPDLLVLDADEAADAADLKRLAAWCRRWCPWTRTDGADGLLLDTTGSDHLWGGEAAMLADMRDAFAGAGLTAHLAIAPTIGAAWGLSRYGRAPTVICMPETLSDTLASLPVAALRLDHDTALLLHRLGLKTVGSLAGISRLALARRFQREKADSANPLRKLDLAVGRIAEPLTAKMPEQPLRTVRRFAEPVAELQSVVFVLEQLLEELCLLMAEKGAGARRLCLTGYRTDGGHSEAAVSISRASRDPAHLAKLFEYRLDRLECGFGFDALVLEASFFDEQSAAQQDLAGNVHEGLEFTRLIDRLVARMGPDAVMRLAPQGSHLPERAEAIVPAGDVPARHDDPPDPALPRPLRLLQRPEETQVLYAVPDGPPAQFVWRKQVHRIVRSEGPERIAPEWWREKSTVRLRDYYRIEDSRGSRYWIFREGLHGDTRGGSEDENPPRWYVHGIDA
ncbi:Y-family DNA polymerase [Minwuia sp.]|uniref:Y-family DNA polymerase n=1 Tax=Minwuia sp. TaxID=2493630 RepID=UPI003A937187